MSEENKSRAERMGEAIGTAIGFMVAIGLGALIGMALLWLLGTMAGAIR